MVKIIFLIEKSSEILSNINSKTTMMIWVFLDSPKNDSPENCSFLINGRHQWISRYNTEQINLKRLYFKRMNKLDL